MTLKVTMADPAKLKPSRDNPRNHSAEQIAKLVLSIEQFGFTQPILTVGSDVVAGHGRLQAAKKLKLKQVPTIKLDGLSDKDKRIAYMIADNKIALEASWDLAKLNKHLKTLSKSLGVDVTGFSEDDLKRIEDDLAEQALSNKRGTGPLSGGRARSADDDDDPPWRNDDEEPDETDDLVNFSCLMEEEHRDELMQIVRECADKRKCNIGEALYFIVTAWHKSAGSAGKSNGSKRGSASKRSK